MSEKNYVRLKITSETLSAKQIGDAIGLGADRTWVVGDRLHPESSATHRTNGWLVESGLTHERELVDHVAALLDKLRPLAREISGLSGQADILFSCVAYGGGAPALYFERKVVDEISSLGAALDIDLYILPQDPAA